jgi:hypothetical protein
MRVFRFLTRNLLLTEVSSHRIGSVSVTRRVHPRHACLLVFILLFAPVALWSVPLVQKNPPVPPADADSPLLIWDIDLKLAKSLPRNFRTTDDPLKSNKREQLPATNGLADLHASGSGEFTADNLKLVLARTRGAVTIYGRKRTYSSTVCRLAGSPQTTGRTLVAVRQKSKRTKAHVCNRSNPGVKSLFIQEKL